MEGSSIRRLLAPAMVALVIASCGGGSSGSPQPSGGAASGAAATEGPATPGESGGGAATQGAPGEAVELTILDHQAPRLDFLKEVLPAFEEEMASQGKNITVKLLEGPATEFETKLTLDFSSDNAPDITSNGLGSVADWAPSGFLLDLTPYLEQWPDYEGHFYETLREEATQADGKVYSVPREATIQQLYYRKDVLDENGISTEQPTSWKELLDRSVEATEAIGKPGLLFPAGSAWGGGTFGEGFIHLMLGTDDQLYDPENGKWIVRSPGLTRVLQYYEEMTTAEVLPVEALLNPEPWVPTKYQAFVKGELAITTCGTWCWIFDWGESAEPSRQIPDIFNKVATWEFPTADGPETFVSGQTGWVWMISANTEHPDEAFELVKWLASGEAMAKNAVKIGAASPRDDLADVAPYSEKPFLADAEQSLEGARLFQSPEGTDKMIQVVGAATEEVITGRMTGEEAADMLAEEATQLLGADMVKEAP